MGFSLPLSGKGRSPARGRDDQEEYVAIDTPRVLFLYELGILRDVEDSGRRLLDFLAHQAKQSDLVQILRRQQQDTDQYLANINSCLKALGSSPTATRSEPVEGIYERFAQFLRLQPAPEMLDQFAVDTAIRFLYIGVSGSKTLLDWAILMKESECAQCLQANLVRKQQGASELERFSHDVGVRLLIPA
jgi:ferritin-like metal-binding protein YciE